MSFEGEKNNGWIEEDGMFLDEGGEWEVRKW